MTYINLTMDRVNEASSDLYESMFESDEDIVKSINDFISLLEEVKEPYS